MSALRMRRTSPLIFVLLAFLLAGPFWVLGSLVPRPRGVPMDLPWSALAVIGPLVAALLLVYLQEGRGGLRRLLARPFRDRPVRRHVWLIPTILLMPAVVGASFLAMSLGSSEAMGTHASFAALPVLLTVFFLAAYCEEIGWTGYALDPWQARFGALPAALLLGVVWTMFHLIPWIQVHGLVWSGGYAVFTIAARVLMVWLYNNTGRSLLAVTLFHDLINTSASLSPYTGSRLSPYLWAGMAVTAAVIVTAVWGPKTLARYRYEFSGETRTP